jgi:hypothetical protein
MQKISHQPSLKTAMQGVPPEKKVEVKNERASVISQKRKVTQVADENADRAAKRAAHSIPNDSTCAL